MDTKSLSLFIFLFLFVSGSFAQFTPEWTAAFSRPDESTTDIVFSKIDNASNVYVACDAYYQNQGSDFVLIKYNSVGTELWKVHYNNPSNTDDLVYAMGMDNSGNIVITGDGGEDMLTVKYNPDGILQWANLYRTPLSSRSISNTVSCDDSGNIFIGGTSTITSGNNRDMVIVKYNSSGILQWSKTFDGPWHSADQTMKLLTDNSGNVYVCGSTVDSNWNSNLTLLKYNTNGDLQWSAIYQNIESPDNDVTNMLIDNNGYIFVTGYSLGTNGGARGIILKYNSQGVLQWKASPPSNVLPNSVFDLVTDNSGNIYTTGAITADGTNTQYYTAKYNSQGIFQWGKSYSMTDGLNKAWKICIDALSNVYVTGLSKGINTETDFATIKYSPSGVQLWAARYKGDNTSKSFGSAINLDNADNVYVSGFSQVSDIYNKVITIKYSQTSGVVNTSSNVPSQYSLGQNYPNPFNPNTKINFSLPKSSFVSLKVFDLSGKEVSGLINENLSAGTYQADFNGANLTSGIYFYTLKTENFSETKKMILIK
ncbi:MAG: T9SS type A sorting domain-containing protein [Bacteroidetes bacterium]|nr:T9SS type A sorting domain-containing protein [Bacteroidota bacterium]